MRVLAVDDDAVVHMALQMAVEDVQFLETNRVEYALDLTERENVDGFIVDRHLPDGDGLDLVRRLRMSKATQRAPIVVLTAGHDPAEEAEALRAGADGYLAKPFEPDEVVGYLEAVSALPEAERRARRRSAVNALEHGAAPTPLVPTTGDEGPHQRVSWWARRRGRHDG